jgi:hypothetical protein
MRQTAFAGTVAASTGVLRSPRIGALVTALIVLSAFAVGGSVGRLTAPVTTTIGADYPGLSELGASETSWRTQHRLDPTRGSASFLPRNVDGLDRFINVAFEGGRVSGFIMQFDGKALDEQGAKLITRAELPPDASLVFDSRKYLGASDIDVQCDLLQYQSDAIGSLFPKNRAGVINVVIWSPGPQGQLSKYDPAGITSINILEAGTLGFIPTEC